MINVVIYARYSSSNQREESIEGQVRICKEYAERNGFVVIHEYIDRAISGKTADRPQFLQMIDDSKRGDFVYVLVYKLDRFSRNRYDNATYKYRLGQSGVRVLSAMETISEGPEGMILEAVLEASAEYYSAELAQKVLRGQMENYKHGIPSGGQLPIGYKREDKKVVVDGADAAVVKRIFEGIISGELPTNIIHDINSTGWRSKKNKKLDYNTFGRIARNVKYTGVVELQGEKYDNIYPCIIPASMFEEAQKLLKKKERKTMRRANDKNPKPFLLTGKVFCGTCGKNMIGDSGRGNHGKIYYYYSCRGRKNDRICKKNNEAKDNLELYVVEQTKKYVFTAKSMKYIASNLMTAIKNEQSSNVISAIEKRLAQIERELNKCFDMIMKTDVQSLLDKANSHALDLQAEKYDLTAELNALKITQRLDLTVDGIMAWLESFSKGDVHDFSYQEKIINAFIKAVYVYDDRITILYNTPANNKTKKIPELVEVSTLETSSDTVFCGRG